MSELKPCPFCGGEAIAHKCDALGQLKGDNYTNYSCDGIGYHLVHFNPYGKICPIAGDDDEGKIGQFIFDTPEEAAEAWNKREGKTE
jgi:hypothetical protein